ncbi:MAG TPA: beta-L-arabinofuranosidase domain-containing protein [Fimbriimonas sp.]|nr:beta-L-arabinofuranosidase domain-containing protein [Fimbriimonas sp.]
MLETLLLSLALAGPRQNLDADLSPIPCTQVHIRDHFWTPRQEINRAASVQHCLDMIAEAGDVHNFELAASGARTGRRGFVFQDSDVYKVIEGASDTLATHPDPALEAKLDVLIDKIAKAQMPDGYVDTYYQVVEPGRRFTNLRDNHELYCAGHLIEAAVAHYHATGKKNLLDIATKYANLLYTTFGPGGKMDGYGGHPELELALVKLSQATSDERYFALAEKLIKTRGSHYFAKEHNTPEGEYDGTYWLDDVPIAQQRDIKGHAVRAAYLMSGATDVVRQDANSAIEAALDKVWRSAIERRIFVTGGIGPSGSNEGFTVDYDLPNLSAYQETCASIAMSMWGYRMGLLHGDARYFDTVETALYNAMLAGVSRDGTKFFYVNPLASNGGHHRQDWFDCACCPPNALRTIAALGGYAYARKGSDVYVNLYLPGTVDLNLDGKKGSLEVQGNYPWDGKLKVVPHIGNGTPMTLHLRVPGWCSKADVRLNGQVEAVSPDGKRYLTLKRDWQEGDSVELDLPMPVERIAANPLVKDDLGRTAVRRGPLIYCAEQTDQSAPVDNMILPLDATLKAQWKQGVLGGIEEIVGTGRQIPEEDWNRKLYQPIPQLTETPVTLIPYCDWDNRKPGAMQVWLPSTPPPAKVGGPEIHAKIGESFLSGNAQPDGINDGIEPKSSGEQPNRLMHWWPHKGTQEWVSYAWAKPVSVRGIKVYWFDDTGRGECRLPQSWHLEKMVGGNWVPVEGVKYPVEPDKWDEVDFDPIKVTALRLVVQLKPGWAAGVRQWKVIEDDSD